MRIRTLIVDDIKLARTRLKQVLSEDPEIEIIGEGIDGHEAVSMIRNLNPDLVFLDVEMPQMNGFEVVEAIGAEEMPTVVFVTAYDEFAVKAFEINAIDYLLKPIEEERFAKTVNRIKREIKELGRGDIESRLLHLLNKVENKNEYARRIPVKTAHHTILITTEDIDWIRGAGNYLELHTGKDVYLIRERLHKLEQSLDPRYFVRIHRSTIVNVERIKALHPMFNDDHIIVLQNGVKLNLSRTYYKKLLELISK